MIRLEPFPSVHPLCYFPSYQNQTQTQTTSTLSKPNLRICTVKVKKINMIQSLLFSFVISLSQATSLSFLEISYPCSNKKLNQFVYFDVFIRGCDITKCFLIFQNILKFPCQNDFPVRWILLHDSTRLKMKLCLFEIYSFDNILEQIQISLNSKSASRYDLWRLFPFPLTLKLFPRLVAQQTLPNQIELFSDQLVFSHPTYKQDRTIIQIPIRFLNISDFFVFKKNRSFPQSYSKTFYDYQMNDSNDHLLEKTESLLYLSNNEWVLQTPHPSMILMNQTITSQTTKLFFSIYSKAQIQKNLLHTTANFGSTSSEEHFITSPRFSFHQLHSEHHQDTFLSFKNLTNRYPHLAKIRFYHKTIIFSNETVSDFLCLDTFGSFSKQDIGLLFSHFNISINT